LHLNSILVFKANNNVFEKHRKIFNKDCFYPIEKNEQGFILYTHQIFNPNTYDDRWCFKIYKDIYKAKNGKVYNLFPIFKNQIGYAFALNTADEHFAGKFYPILEYNDQEILGVKTTSEYFFNLNNKYKLLNYDSKILSSFDEADFLFFDFESFKKPECEPNKFDLIEL